MNRLLVALALTSLSTAAIADTATLFRDGEFVEAGKAGAQEGTPESLVLAARSVLAVAAYRTPDKARALQLCDSAARLTDLALAKRPGYAPALLQKGIAIGYIAKLERSPGRAKAARRLMDQARGLAPSDPLAWAALGGWHGESVATLGSFLAGTALGARKSESLKAFDAALTKDGAGATVPTFYAFTLLALDTGNAARARALLEQASRSAPKDGYEALLKQRAEQVLPLLQRNDVAGARALAKRLQPFGGLA